MHVGCKVSSPQALKRECRAYNLVIGHALSVLDQVFQVLVMAGLNARGLQSKLLITPLSE